MLIRLGVDESMKVAKPRPVTRVPRVKKRKLDCGGDGYGKRSSDRLNTKAKNPCGKEEKKLHDGDGEDIMSTVKVFIHSKTI